MTNRNTIYCTLQQMLCFALVCFALLVVQHRLGMSRQEASSSDFESSTVHIVISIF